MGPRVTVLHFLTTLPHTILDHLTLGQQNDRSSSPNQWAGNAANSWSNWNRGRNWPLFLSAISIISHSSLGPLGSRSEVITRSSSRFY